MAYSDLLMFNSAALQPGIDAGPRSILATRKAPLNCGDLRLFTKMTPGRLAVERYIARVFSRVHGATINEFMPRIITLTENGRTKAALGVRHADEGRLFLESYLDTPLLGALANHGFPHLARADVVEIGNLAVTRAGNSQLLLIVLTQMLFEARRNVAIFTATDKVARLLAKLGLELMPICKAEQHCVHNGSDQWGRYYNNAPHVIAVDVAQAAHHLRAQQLIEKWLCRYNNDIERLAAYL